MAGQAAYKSKIQVSADDVTYYDVPATSPSIEIGGDVLDVTELKTNTGFRSRINGLHDFSLNADSNYLAGEAALVILRDAKLNRTNVFFKMLPDGAVATDGFTGECVVETYNISGDIGGMISVAISLQGTSALTALTV